MKISIIVPVFNEESTIGLVLDRLADLEIEREVIVIDDGSTDSSGAVIRGHHSELVIEHMGANVGKGAAVRRGIELSTGDIVVIQDADLEVHPGNIGSLVQPILEGGADAVYGSRFLVKHPGVRFSRRLANRFLTASMNVLYGLRLTDMETAHKAIRGELARSLTLASDRFDIEVELTARLARGGARIVEVPTPYEPRNRDEGKKIRVRDGFEALRSIWRWRTLPRKALSTAVGAPE